MRHTSLFRYDGSTVWKWSVVAGILVALMTLSAGLFSLLQSHDSLYAPKFCTVAGADAEVSLYIPRPEINVEKGVSVDFTVNGQDYHLKAEHFQPQHRPGGVYIRQPLPFDTPAGDVKINISFTSADGTEQKLIHTAPLELVEPNGPDCDPHVYQFNSVIHESQFLTYEEWEKAAPKTAEAESVMDGITLSPEGISDDAIPHK